MARKNTTCKQEEIQAAKARRDIQKFADTYAEKYPEYSRSIEGIRETLRGIRASRDFTEESTITSHV